MVNPTTPPIPTSISGLPTAGSIGGGEWIAISQNGVTVKTATNTLGGVGPVGPPGPAGASGTVVPWAVATGSANAITAAYSPPNGSLTDGLLLSFRALAANSTTTPTFAPDGLTAHVITDDGGSAVAVNAIPAALAECLVRYNLAHTRWELLNPAGGGGVTTTGSPSTGNLAKFSSGSSITNTDLTGDVTTSGGSATTLKTVNATTGSFTAANITVNGKGLITAASSGSVGVRGNTYQVTDTTDISLSQAPAQANLGSTKSITIPTKGIITLAFEGKLTSASTGTGLVLGIRIAATNYYPSYSQNGGAQGYFTVLNDFGGGGSITHAQGFDSGGVVAVGGTVGLSIEGYSIPTGVQTVQFIVAAQSGILGTVNGTSVASKGYITVYDFT